MTDPSIPTKDHPGALDGLERAKPDEPVFTLQGGDPIAIEAVKFWINLRREQALKLDDGKERDAELIRCTEAEKVLWAMQAYLNGYPDGEDAAKERPDEPDAVDLFDFRVRSAQKISSHRCDIIEIRQELERRGFIEIGNMANAFAMADDTLIHINRVIEPRRMIREAIGLP